MKKVCFAVLFVLVLLLGVGAVSAYAEALSPDGSVLFEKDGVKVTTAGLDTDPTTEDVSPIIWLDIENTGDKDAFLGVANGSVNGFMSDAVLIDFYVENGKYCGGNYTFDLTLPAGSSGRYALGYYKTGAPGVDSDVLAEMELCFTTAKDEYSWPDYCSDPVTIVTGEEVEAVDIASLGTVVIDDEKLTLVIGELDYDDFFGPEVYVYAENKSDHFLGLAADSAVADGADSDYVLYGSSIAPGKRSAAMMCFEGAIRELKGFENLTLGFSLREAATKDALDAQFKGASLEPVTVQYPPQVWGEYENGGLHLEIQPKYNKLITVKTPADDAYGVLFEVSETASLEAGSFDGAGWLFSIGKVSEERLHEMLCHDMSGANVFAKAEDGGYYMFYHPTDVRYARSTTEEMYRDQAQWSMLCQWAWGVQDSFAEKNGLEQLYYGNSEVDIYVSRAAWMNDGSVTLSTTEFGPVEIMGVDGSAYAEYVMQGGFSCVDSAETPDGEYVVLNFPKEDVRLDFFFAPGAYVRVVLHDQEMLYQAMLYDEDLSCAEAMKGWYYAAAERVGIKSPDESLALFCGSWIEKIAGRGRLTIAPTLAPGKVTIEASWPESAAVLDTWEMKAALNEDGKLIYNNGVFISTKYDEGGEAWEIDSDWSVSGEFTLNSDGELCWRDSRAADGTFIRG